jgi:hypothetical protein
VLEVLYYYDAESSAPDIDVRQLFSTGTGSNRQQFLLFEQNRGWGGLNNIRSKYGGAVHLALIATRLTLIVVSFEAIATYALFTNRTLVFPPQSSVSWHL